jgi:hypothetical protein
MGCFGNYFCHAFNGTVGDPKSIYYSPVFMMACSAKKQSPVIKSKFLNKLEFSRL